MAEISTASPARLLPDSFQEASRHFIPVIKRGWLVIFASAFILEIQHLLLLWYGRNLNVEWGEPMANFIAGLLASSVYILIIPVFAMDIRDGRPNTNFLEHSKKSFSAVIIEMLRVAAKVTIGLFLLLIPGIIWSVQLTFVPLIAQFDRDYIAGKVDALEYSTRMVRGRFFWIFVLCVVFFLSGLVEHFKFYFQPTTVEYWFFFLITVFVQIYMYIVFVAVYSRISSQTPAVTSIAGHSSPS